MVYSCQCANHGVIPYITLEILYFTHVKTAAIVSLSVPLVCMPGHTSEKGMAGLALISSDVSLPVKTSCMWNY